MPASVKQLAADTLLVLHGGLNQARIVSFIQCHAVTVTALLLSTTKHICGSRLCYSKAM